MITYHRNDLRICALFSRLSLLNCLSAVSEAISHNSGAIIDKQTSLQASAQSCLPAVSKAVHSHFCMITDKPHPAASPPSCFLVIWNAVCHHSGTIMDKRTNQQAFFSKLLTCCLEGFFPPLWGNKRAEEPVWRDNDNSTGCEARTYSVFFISVCAYIGAFMT